MRDYPNNQGDRNFLDTTEGLNSCSERWDPNKSSQNIDLGYEDDLDECMETKPLINRTVFRIYQLVPIQFNSFPHNLFANVKKLHAFIGIYVHFIWLILRFEYGGQVNHSVFWLAPIPQNTFLLIQAEKRTKRDAVGPYIWTSMNQARVKFFCVLGCVGSACSVVYFRVG